MVIVGRYRKHFLDSINRYAILEELGYLCKRNVLQVLFHAASIDKNGTEKLQQRRGSTACVITLICTKMDETDLQQSMFPTICLKLT